MWCWCAEPDRWVAYFSTDPDLSVASILETVADRSALEQVFHDVKEVHGAGQQQLRHVWANVGAWNLIGWWPRWWSCGPGTGRSPVARPERLAVGQARASSVACQSLSGVTSRGVTGRIFVATVSGGLAHQKSAGSFSTSCAGSHEADSSGKVQDFHITLEARNPARRCFRQYRVEAGTDLFGVWVVEISYGRIGTTGRCAELCPSR